MTEFVRPNVPLQCFTIVSRKHYCVYRLSSLWWLDKRLPVVATQTSGQHCLVCVARTLSHRPLRTIQNRRHKAKHFGLIIVCMVPENYFGVNRGACVLATLQRCVGPVKA